jgi:hypothetical protein
MFRSSNCGLSAAKNCHPLDSVPLQWGSLFNRHIKREINRPYIGVEDVYPPSAQKAAAGRQLISMSAHCWGSHLAIV